MATTQTPLSPPPPPPPPPPPSPPNLAVGQLHAGVDPEKEEEDPVPLMKQLGPCAKPYIALQVIDPRSRVTEVFCVHASYHIIMMYICIEREGGEMNEVK